MSGQRRASGKAVFSNHAGVERARGQGVSAHTGWKATSNSKSKHLGTYRLAHYKMIVHILGGIQLAKDLA